MGRRDHALGHEGGGHGDLLPLGKGDQPVGRPGADHAVSRQDHRKFRRRDQFRGLADLPRRRDRRRGALHLQRLLPLNVHLGNVLGKIDEAHARSLGLRLLEGLADDLGNRLGLDHLGAVLRDRPKQVDQVQVLVALLMHSRGGRLARYGHDRGIVHVGVGHARNQVRRTRPQGRQTDAGPARQPPVDIGHEGRRLLVPRRYEAHRASAQRLHDVEVLLPGDAEDELHTLVLQAANEEFGGLHFI